MDPELFSQEGMELSCRNFNRRLNAETDHRGPSFNVLMKSQYESCSFTDKTLLLSFSTEEYMRNPAGVLHGGALSGALDLTMGSLTFYMSGEFLTPTINLNVSFERPVPTGIRLFVEAKCLSCGRTMAYAAAKAWLQGEPNKIVVSGTGTFFTASGIR